MRVERDAEVPREVVQRGVDDAEVVAEGKRAEARDEHARQDPHEQLAALQGLKLGFWFTSLEVGGGGGGQPTAAPWVELPCGRPHHRSLALLLRSVGGRWSERNVGASAENGAGPGGSSRRDRRVQGESGRVRPGDAEHRARMTGRVPARVTLPLRGNI